MFDLEVGVDLVEFLFGDMVLCVELVCSLYMVVKFDLMLNMV